MRAGTEVPRLSRRTWPAPPPDPVRQVHLGPGAFFRAHPAWCTALAGDGWGIAAVGRTPASTAALAEQGGLYGVLVRGEGGDRARVLGAVSATADLTGLGALLADPAVAVVTLSVTEAGYAPGSPVLAALAAALARRGEAPLALVPCDNVAGSGPLLRDRLLALAPGLAPLVDDGTLTCPSTVVDRITPAATDQDRRTAAGLLGVDDRALVVTEPDLEWVVEGDFPAGRPAWERAGARVVADARPFATRKLRILNAGHSLLAYAGGAAGHRHVHEAAADPRLRGAVEALWAEATRWMAPAEAAVVDRAYLDGVLRRWSNARLPHPLAQIAADGAAKLGQRAAPTLLAAAAAGVAAPATCGLVAAWVSSLRGATPLVAPDAREAELGRVRRGPPAAAARAALAVLDPRLAGEASVVAAVAAQVPRSR